MKKQEEIKKTTSFQMIPQEDDYWKKGPQLLFINYEEEFKRKPRGNNCLEFDNKEQAMAFFTKQAQQGLSFLMSRLDEKTNAAVDDHVFSCGNKKLYTGTFSHIKQELEKDLKSAANQEDKGKIQKGLDLINKYVSPTQNYREKMKEMQAPAVSEEKSLKP